MFAEAIKALADLSQQAGESQKTQIVDLSSYERPGVYGLLRADGAFEKRFADPEPRDDSLHSIDQIADYISAVSDPSVAGDGPEEGGALATVVWINDHQVVVSLDEASEDPRPPKAVCPLPTTEEWDRLVRLSDDRPMYDQREFVQLLRIDLADVLTDAAQSLIKAVRVLRWSSGAKTDATVGRSRESLGTQLEADVVAEAGDIPETVILNVRPFDDRAVQTRVAIKCAVEVYASQHQLQLIPLPGELRRALDSTVAEIQQRLAGECDCPVLYGSK